MSCCGKARQAIGGASPVSHLRPKTPPVSALRYVIIFEYTGNTGLTAIGPVSGNRYRFDVPGARVRVDPRDRPGLAKIPNLRQV